ncbi:MAG: family 16 glycoside hydrolase [Candidatus Binatia bacterium]
MCSQTARFRFLFISTLVLIALFSYCPPFIAAQQSDLPASTAGESQPPPEKAKPPYKVALDFDNFESGTVPTGFRSALAGEGQKVSWVVKEEPSAPSGTKVLAQTSVDELGYRFPILVYDKFTTGDVEVSVQFKTISGKVDQVAGIIARFQDQDHFYMVRADALEGEVKLYKVVDGVRQSLARENAQVTPGEWHTLKLAVKDDHFAVFLNGKSLFEADDETFAAAGKVGLATKADSVTIFDNLQIESDDPNWIETQADTKTKPEDATLADTVSEEPDKQAPAATPQGSAP